MEEYLMGTNLIFDLFIKINFLFKKVEYVLNRPHNIQKI